MKNISTIEDYISQLDDRWKPLIIQLQKILRSSNLQESIKWGAPVYSFKNKNIAGIGAFKAYVGLWFFQGVLLADEAGKLINAQEGKTKALRQWRIASIEEIDIKLIKAYVQESIRNLENGIEIKPEKTTAVHLPPELEEALKNNATAKYSFQKLSLSKRKEYADYIAEAKRSDTKTKRLKKIIPMIIRCKGLNDKYRPN